MMKIAVRKSYLVLALLAAVGSASFYQSVSASPFGQGEFGADVPFGSMTSISMAFSGDVAFTLTPGGGNYSGQGSHTVTVTSTDVVGYKLYALAPAGTNMTSGGGATIPASANSSPAALSINTWGFNTTGSTTNYTGMLTTPREIKDADGPYTSGDDTDVYYGAYVDITKPATSYTVEVVYTVVAEFQ